MQQQERGGEYPKKSQLFPSIRRFWSSLHC
jgi:hypothetical protein